jgi:acyl-homoserine lactone acylase PvdQ
VVADTLPGGVVVGGSAWARAQAAPLRTGALDAAAWATRDASAWADTLRAAWTPALAPLAGRDTTLAQALAYLRNWNGAYDRASIGASLFDAWMARLRARRGDLPTPPDTAYFGAYRRRQAFAAAVARLRHRFGPDLRRWRWERVAPDRRPYPVWSADSLTARDLGALAQTTFAPRVQPGEGHPSAPAGGPSLALPSAPAAVTAWTDGAGGLKLLRLAPPTRAFLSRYTTPDRRRTPTPLAAPADAPTTRLRPAG